MPNPKARVLLATRKQRAGELVDQHFQEALANWRDDVIATTLS